MTNEKPYHHGNLQKVLVDLAYEGAREHGPDAIALRDMARQAGVSPMAVYRHFENQNALLQAVTVRILDTLAESMREQLAKYPTGSVDSILDTLQKLHAICYGYVMFSQREPKLFRTIWSKNVEHATALELEARDDEPYRLLSDNIDALVRQGYLREDDSMAAKLNLWSTAHGLAVLAIEGPLRTAPAKQREKIVRNILDMTLRGIKSTS